MGFASGLPPQATTSDLAMESWEQLL